MARMRIDDSGNTELAPADVEAGVGDGGGERSPRTSGETPSGVVGTALSGGGVCGRVGEKMEMGRGGVVVMLAGASAARECVSWDRPAALFAVVVRAYRGYFAAGCTAVEQNVTGRGPPCESLRRNERRLAQQRGDEKMNGQS